MSLNYHTDRQWRDKSRQRERFAGFAYTLARVDWNFLPLTLSKIRCLRKPCASAMFWRWCLDASEISGVPYKDLLIAFRGELGEIGGRPHGHSLLGGVAACNLMSLRS